MEYIKKYNPMSPGFGQDRKDNIRSNPIEMANEDMENTVSLLNRLQDIASQVQHNSLKNELPQIVVVGGQSVGKSSVLEGIVGRSFLPRGEGIVTRCPLNLQLITHDEDYFIFGSGPGSGTKLTDPEEVRDHIEAETHRMAGSNKNVIDTPITLKYYSPSVLDLTLVDLPGLTKVPVGDQPSDIGRQIEELVKSYVKMPNILILAVTPANSDLATSDALKLAAEVDPEKIRTIGVLTKIDLMDKETNARDALLNNIYPLKLGYYGVRNRSQKDINSNKDMITAINDERKFFSSHPAYSDMKEKMGISFLQKFLNKLLVHHIKANVSALKATVKARVRELEVSLAEFANSSNKDPKVLYLNLSQIVQAFRDKFEKIIGISDNSNAKNSKSNLSKGYVMSLIINGSYHEELEVATYTEEQLNGVISEELKMKIGIKQPVFAPNSAFDAVVRKQIERFLSPSHICVDLIEDKVKEVIEECLEDVENYPTLKKEMQVALNECVKNVSMKTRKKIATFTRIQSSYTCINSGQKELTGLAGIKGEDDQESVVAIPSWIFEDRGSVGKNKSLVLSQKGILSQLCSGDVQVEDKDVVRRRMDKNNVDIVPQNLEKTVEIFKSVFQVYINETIKTTYRDYVPKIVYSRLIMEVKEFIGFEMMATLQFDKNGHSNLENLMSLSRDVRKRLDKWEEDRKVYEEALKVLSEVSM